MPIAIDIFCIAVLIGLGAFFSGSETGVYRMSRFQLRLGIEQKRPSYSLLQTVLDDSQGVVFSILVGNNLVNYAATSMVTLLFVSEGFGQKAAFYATLVMTPVLFICSEVIPKNIYYYRSDVLMPRFAPLLYLFYKLFSYTGFVWLLKTFSNLFSKIAGLSGDATEALTVGRKAPIRRIIHESREERILSPLQNDIMNRLLKMPSISLAAVMTPAAKVEMLNVKSKRSQVLEVLARCPYTNYPVYEKKPSRVTGFVSIYEVLNATEDFQDLSKFLKPIKNFPASKPVIDTMNTMRIGRHKIVLVTKGGSHGRKKKDRFVGIVTMKDLVEELTGELAEW